MKIRDKKQQQKLTNLSIHSGSYQLFLHLTNDITFNYHLRVISMIFRNDIRLFQLEIILISFANFKIFVIFVFEMFEQP
jgi:hypothetical protein